MLGTVWKMCMGIILSRMKPSQPLVFMGLAK